MIQPSTVVAAFCVLVSQSIVVAQRPAQPPKLSQLVDAKIVSRDGESRLILMVPSFRTSEIVTERTTASFRIERGEDESGELFEKRVPLGKNVTRRDMRLDVKNAGFKPRTLDINSVKFFDLNMKAVSVQQASEMLSTLTPIFLIDNGGKVGALPAVQAKAFSQNVMILMTKEDVRKDPRRRQRGVQDPFGNPFGGADPFGDDDPFGGPVAPQIPRAVVPAAVTVDDAIAEIFK